jgi:FXSXX-COOH protein
MAMESTTTPIPLGQTETASIVDLRNVPLGQLTDDDDVRHWVRGMIESDDDSSRVRVAMFSSAI